MPGPIGEAKNRYTDFFLYFLLLFPLCFAAKIAAETNRYASEDWVKADGSSCTKDTPGARHRYKGTWEKVTAGEIYMVVAIRIRQGSRGVRDLRQSWSTDAGIHDADVVRFMTGERFTDILSMLHFMNNTAYRASVAADPSKRDPLYKIRPVIALMNKLMPRFFDCGDHLSGDECRVCMKNRSAIWLMRYNPHKPLKHAADIKMITNAETGVPIQFEIQVAGSTPLADVMLKLVTDAGLAQGGPGHYWRVLVTDSLYTSVSLATRLYKCGVGLIGTVRLARKPSSAAREESAYKNTAWHTVPKSVSAHIARGDHWMALKVVDGCLLMSAAVMDKMRFGFLASAHISGKPADQARPPSRPPGGSNVCRRPCRVRGFRSGRCLRMAELLTYGVHLCSGRGAHLFIPGPPGLGCAARVKRSGSIDAKCKPPVLVAHLIALMRIYPGGNRVDVLFWRGGLICVGGFFWRGCD